MQTYVWVLVVLVIADGQWRDWKSFNRLQECEEVATTITYHREDKIIARCDRRVIE